MLIHLEGILKVVSPVLVFASSCYFVTEPVKQALSLAYVTTLGGAPTLRIMG